MGFYKQKLIQLKQKEKDKKGEKKDLILYMIFQELGEVNYLLRLIFHNQNNRKYLLPIQQ
jgi:hypothetical protein